jgi:TonB family protein
MTKAEHHGKRAHARRRILPVAYVELGLDNGGILLNLSEGGLGVRSVLPLTSREFRGIRFQAPMSQAWLTASGRMVWLSESKKEGGIQFTEMAGEARQQIHKWASAAGDPDDAGECLPASSAGSWETPKRIPDMHNRETAGEPAIATGTRAQTTLRQRAPMQAEAGAAPVQNFRFTEYSMFAAEPEKEGVWIEPARYRRGWGGTALLVLFVAAVSFTLGSTVGRGSLDHWIAYLRDAAENQLAPAPKVTPPTPPEQPDASETAKNTNSASSGDQPKADESTNPVARPAGNSQVAATPATEKKDELPKGVTEPKNSSADSEMSAAGSTARSAIARDSAQRQPRSADNAMPRTDLEVDAGPSSTAAGHSILVNPPGPSGRPFYVNLPAETISASPAIAISAQRTLQIQPSASGRSERVVIGTLKSHSDPFYPVEARKQRLEGSVELRARVGRTGQIIAVTPVSGPDLLVSAAATAVREWRYEPTFVDGDPVEILADITIVFRRLN